MAARASACHHGVEHFGVRIAASYEGHFCFTSAAMCSDHEHSCVRRCCVALWHKQLTIRHMPRAGGPGAAQQLPAARARAHGGRMTRGHNVRACPNVVAPPPAICTSAVCVGCMAGVCEHGAGLVLDAQGELFAFMQEP